jgi:NADH-quinone oxidoreductase subunit E
MLTDEIKNEIAEEVVHCVRRQCACIEAMQIVQRHHGWVSDEHVRDISEYLGMSAADLESVATFYNHIYRKPVGRHIIMVCDSVSCWIMGYDHIRDYLTERLGITLGETTADGRFTMVPIQCLGACDHAPAIMIDDELFGDLTPEAVDRILERYR